MVLWDYGNFWKTLLQRSVELDLNLEILSAKTLNLEVTITTMHLSLLSAQITFWKAYFCVLGMGVAVWVCWVSHPLPASGLTWLWQTESVRHGGRNKVCVRESEWERETDRERERERERQRENRKRDTKEKCVWVCVFVCERERERLSNEGGGDSNVLQPTRRNDRKRGGRRKKLRCAWVSV